MPVRQPGDSLGRSGIDLQKSAHSGGLLAPHVLPITSQPLSLPSVGKPAGARVVTTSNQEIILFRGYLV